MEIKTKKEIRKQIVKLRANISYDEYINKSSIITNKILSCTEYKGCRNLYIYMNMEKEVSTKEIISDALKNGKDVWIPKTFPDVIKFYRITKLSEVELGTYNVFEPVSGEESTYDEGLVIVPMVAFDSDRNRIGYGKGYYDRFLSLNPILENIGIAFEMQRTNKIYTEITDVRLSKIFTESNML
ncbi:MAG: 5-formyltetrahydrofolate cyclo-ligase [Suipraeoptans sp.]